MKKIKTTLLPGIAIAFLCLSYYDINAQDVNGSWSGTETGLNLKNANGNNNYFGDATYGNCLSQIKLK